MVNNPEKNIDYSLLGGDVIIFPRVAHRGVLSSFDYFFPPLTWLVSSAFDFAAIWVTVVHLLSLSEVVSFHNGCVLLTLNLEERDRAKDPLRFLSPASITLFLGKSFPTIRGSADMKSNPIKQT